MVGQQNLLTLSCVSFWIKKCDFFGRRAKDFGHFWMARFVQVFFWPISGRPYQSRPRFLQSVLIMPQGTLLLIVRWVSGWGVGLIFIRSLKCSCGWVFREMNSKHNVSRIVNRTTLVTIH